MQNSNFIRIDSEHYLSPPTEKDIPALVKYLNDKDIFDRTLMIPFPYTEEAANWFIGYSEHLRNQFGHDLNMMIRQNDGSVIGGIGYHGKNNVPPLAHKDEIGYWIGKPFEGKGIMTKALAAMVEYGFNTRRLVRIEAPVYAHNIGSQKVLLKCGFKEEGYLPKAYFKNGIFQDGKLFALVR